MCLEGPFWHPPCAAAAEPLCALPDGRNTRAAPAFCQGWAAGSINAAQLRSGQAR